MIPWSRRKTCIVCKGVGRADEEAQWTAQIDMQAAARAEAEAQKFPPIEMSDVFAAVLHGDVSYAIPELRHRR